MAANAVPFPGFSSPAAGLDAPFEMLQACHQRVERMVVLLQRLHGHAMQHGCDSQVQQAARDVMRYFDLAAPLHHQDEELHIFPAVLAGPKGPARDAVPTLLAQHRQMEPLWAQLRGLLRAMATPPAPDAALLPCPLPGDLVDAFAALYRAHIALEETVVYPQAQLQMDAGQVAAASADMMQRRGVKPA